jgi:hypothetical protein
MARRATLFVTYLIPLFFIGAIGEFAPPHWVVWIVMLYGVMFSTRNAFRWSLPRMWRTALAYWGVLAALTWPIIMLRESDFQLWWVPSAFGAVSAEAALLVMTGILWFDWLFSQYSADDHPAFEGEIILPLGMGWMIAGCLGVYQMFGHIAFLNPPFWAGLRRAAGSVGDANVFGVTSALWGPALVAVASARSKREAWWIAAAGLPLSWLAVWASGSRSSVPIVVVGIGGVLYALWRATKSTRFIAITGAALLVASAAAVGMMRSRPSVVGPVSRIVEDFQPRWSMTWVRTVGSYLWTRNGYGLIAQDMIRQSPFVGIGLGAFNPLVFLYSWQRFRLFIPPDNAQNWYRHQLAEVGVIGSVGWMIWCGSFLTLLIVARGRQNCPSGAVLRVILIGFGLISLVGVPAQNIVVAFTFWTFAFWFVGEVGRWPCPGRGLKSPHRLTWAALWLLVFVHAGGTVIAALTYLRPPSQAMRANMDYSLGFYEPEDDSAFRWTRQRAVVVLIAVKPWVELTVRATHADLPNKPVDVKVWVNQKLAVRTQLASAEPITRYMPSGDRGKRMMLETWVSRVERPRDRGQDDPRDLGLQVRWNFVDEPPHHGAVESAR